MALESKYDEYELVSIPDKDLEEQLEIILIKGIEYFVGFTGNLYSKADRHIVGKIKDWKGFDKSNNISIELQPVIGLKSFFNR